jgi:Putative adhesin
MGKRLFAVLLALTCCAAGVTLLRAPDNATLATVSHWLMRVWPLLLVLAGLVRVSNYLIDRQPRSPVGGFILSALGGILFVVQWRGESFSLATVGKYWFWLLLAFVIGRVLWQYTHRSTDKAAPRLFSSASVFAMLLIVASGLASTYLSRNTQVVAQLNSRLNQLSANVLGESITIADDAPQTFTLLAKGSLLIERWNGDVEIRSTELPQPRASLIKRIRATDETQARAMAANIQLQIRTNGTQLEFAEQATNVSQPFSTQLIIELPANVTAPITITDARGDVTLRNTKGNHVIRQCGGLTVAQHQGSLQIEAARGALQIQDVTGDLKLDHIQHDTVIDNLKGALQFTANAGNHRFTTLIGALKLNLKNARLDLRNAQAPPQLAADQPVLFIESARDSRLQLREIKGATVINATHSRIAAEALTGDLSIQSSNESVEIARHTGKLQINNENGAVEVRDVTGATTIEAGRDVSVQNFSGALAVETEYSTVTLTHNGALHGTVNVNTERGQIKLNFPTDIAFRLDASTESGHIRAKGFAGITTERRQTTLTANYNATAASSLVTLRTTRGNIELRAIGQAVDTP